LDRLPLDPKTKHEHKKLAFTGVLLWGQKPLAVRGKNPSAKTPYLSTHLRKISSLPTILLEFLALFTGFGRDLFYYFSLFYGEG